MITRHTRFVLSAFLCSAGFYMPFVTAAPPAAPASAPVALSSGPEVGGEAPAFDPRHVAGPDKGSHACPMCKYGSGQGALIWWNSENLGDAGRIAARLEREMRAKGPKRLRAFVIYMNPAGRPVPDVERTLKAFAGDASLSQVAVAYVPSPTDSATSALYSINPDPRVRNTIIVYRKRRVFDKFVNLAADDASLDRLVSSIERAETAP